MFLITLFFKKCPRVDPSDFNNISIRKASENGHSTTVELLLSDPRVDPSTKDNEAIRKASANGNFDVVKVLLTDPRVDPSTAIRLASKFGNYAIVKLLLVDPRIDPSTAKIRKACKSVYSKVVLAKILFLRWWNTINLI